ASKAKVIGLANAGGDTTNSIKQAAEFGIVKGGQNLAGLLVFLTDIHALGLPTAQGLIVTNTFYWDSNDQTRAFAKRFAERDKGIYPTMIHAGVYSALTHYLKAVEALKNDDGTTVIAKMKETPTDDPLFGKGSIRVDGRTIHPAYLVEVKKPSESKGPWHYYKVRATIPGDQACRPRLLVVSSGCADRRRRVRGHHRTNDALAFVQARPSLWAVVDVRSGTDHPGPFPQPVRFVRVALPDAGCAHRWDQSRLHVPPEVPRVGDRRLAHHLSRVLVRDRAHQARGVSAGRDR